MGFEEGGRGSATAKKCPVDIFLARGRIPSLGEILCLRERPVYGRGYLMVSSLFIWVFGVMGLEEGGRDLPVFYLRLFLYNSPRFCYYMFWEAMA
jgi:hypothetical protein